MNVVHPVLLAGGLGTRLWPVSRRSYPKQFSNIIGGKTLFQQSALRLSSSPIIKFMSHIVLTNSDFRFIIGEQMQQVEIDPGPILIEPELKNTASSILAASLYAKTNYEDALLLVAPSDHIISDTKYFHRAIEAGIKHVQRGKIVTFGVTPTFPETGYGYLKLSSDTLDDHKSAAVEKFIEKPLHDEAVKILASENYLWNMGIYLFKAEDMIDAFQMYAPDMLRLVSNAVEAAIKDLGFLRLDPKFWSELENISIDFAIMEKCKNLVAVPYYSKWSDLGDWASIFSELPKDKLGNYISEGAYSIDCHDSLLRSESPGQKIVGIGLENIMAIAMPDAVLVANKNRSQDVKKSVELLRVSQVSQAEIFPKVHRPWGWFESLAMGTSFQVKRICVNPNAALSLQSHKYRSEHWIVVEGTAKVTIDGKEDYISEGRSTYVPLNAIHRLENLGEVPVILIEVQIGSYLGEDDIIRYDDIYARK